MTAASPPPRRHVLTVALEDYFQVNAFDRVIRYGQWYRFEARLDGNTRKALDLLARLQTRATFFVTGWVAEHFPAVVRLVADRGHEVASQGYYHRGIGDMTPAEFRADVRRARAAVERASGRRVWGHRVADQWFGPGDLWALPILAEEGFAYDASLGPVWRRFAREPWRRYLHRVECDGRSLWEFPLPTVRVLGRNLPIGGGNYMRQLPHGLVRRAVDRWHRTADAPFVFYFHVWELDPGQPRINIASVVTRLRHYRNLGKMRWVLEDYLRRYPFTGIADYLGLPAAAPDSADAPPLATVRVDLPASLPTRGTGKRLPVTVVLPCYNEELVLPYLANTLASVREALVGRYDLHFVFVDDGSTDGTWAALGRLFGRWPHAAVVRHPHNRGVAAAILTGIRHARTEVVCSADCDCTYDPHDLARLIPLLEDGVDLVTASPYHPDGLVRNVPGWRLLLSRGASFLYRRLLRHKLYTYTSCFRVYRRSAVAGLPLREGGFLGIAEMVIELDRRGARIVEHPATLEVRLLGRSKIAVVRTIAGHLRLLGRLALAKALRREPRPRTEAEAVLQADTPASDDHTQRTTA